MAGFNFPFKGFRPKASNLPVPTASPSNPAPVTPQPPTPIKSITALERQMQAEAQAAQPYPIRSRPLRQPLRLGKPIALAALIGVPIAALWFVNLPYAIIRRPVAKTAPILLLPSYVSMDNHYKKAIAAVEQAKQLINQPTSPADIDLGAQRVDEAQKHLGALPVSFLTDYPAYQHWWYDWRFSPIRFSTARATIGTLRAKVIQEQNAQLDLTAAGQALTAAKQQYQQAATSVDQQAAIAAWREAIGQFEQISGQTLAGEIAQQQRLAHQQDFQTTVGLAAGSEKVSTLIEAARQFGWQAAQASQNPPHSVEEWQRIEALWQDAIDRLERIPPDDLAGYAEAQKRLAEYKANQAQIGVRRQAEADSVQALARAQQQITQLQASIPSDGTVDRNRLISQLQAIINQLERVQEGTTAYLKAQELLLSAQNKLNQL